MSETSCSPERPPNKTATRSFFKLPFSYKFNFQLKFNTKFFTYRFLRQMNQGANIFRLGLTMIDKKIAVLRADLSIADASPFKSRGFDQTARMVARRVFEHGTHARTRRLRGLSAFAEFIDFSRHFFFA